MTLIRKDSNKVNIVNNFRPITLLNIELNILAKVLAKRLVRVVSSLAGEAQTCAMLNRTIHNNIRFIRYTLEWIGEISGKGGALVHLNQSKVFGRVDHRRFSKRPG